MRHCTITAIFLGFAACADPAFAATLTLSFGECVSDSSNSGDRAWLNPSNAVDGDDGDLVASASLLSTAAPLSHRIYCDQIDTTGIFDGATINGLELRYRRKVSAALDVDENEVAAVDDTGTVSSTNRATTDLWSTSFETVTRGGSSDLWSECWCATTTGDCGTPACFNLADPDTGFVIVAEFQDVSSSVNAQVEFIELDVHFTQGDTPTPTITDTPTNTPTPTRTPTVAPVTPKSIVAAPRPRRLKSEPPPTLPVPKPRKILLSR